MSLDSIDGTLYDVKVYNNRQLRLSYQAIQVEKCYHQNGIDIQLLHCRQTPTQKGEATVLNLPAHGDTVELINAQSKIVDTIRYEQSGCTVEHGSGLLSGQRRFREL